MHVNDLKWMKKHIASMYHFKCLLIISEHFWKLCPTQFVRVTVLITVQKPFNLLRSNAKHALNPRELYCSKLILNNCITKIEGVNNHCKKTRLEMKNFTFFLFDSDFPLMNINTSQVTKSVNYQRHTITLLVSVAHPKLPML